MTKDGEWGIISLAGIPLTPAAGEGGGRVPTPKPTPKPDPKRTPLPGEAGTTGPVMGVTSKSTGKGFRLWEGRSSYNEWRFTEESLGLKPMEGGGSGQGPGPGGPRVPRGRKKC